MSVLASIREPGDLRGRSAEEFAVLADEIRALLVERVSATGGHLGPNLGVVELTLAVHAEFDSPRDRILFDTGHQSYVHKIITGRADGLVNLRRRGGLSGYPSSAESAHDIIENSHASTALSYADGLARAYTVRGERDRSVVAIIGDGALTGGMAWEALNNIAAARHPNLVIVVNDNGRSYAPTVGGLAEHLIGLRTAPQYEQVLEGGKRLLAEVPVVGPALYRGLHGLKAALRDIVTPDAMFENIGLKYLGPIDGHDVDAMRHALRHAREFPGPVVVHCITRKGAGYAPAEQDEADCFHGIGVIDPVTGRPRQSPAAPSWTSIFGEELAKIGTERPDLVAITAAMRKPVGLEPFALAYPDRVFDVGIAEQHAITSAVGQSMGGLHPVVALYATFLNRAFDQVLMDAALHRAGITVVLDRAGVTGDDGPSHNGMWDLSMLQIVPGLRIAAPRDAATLRAELREAVEVDDAPTVLRYPKGTVPKDIPAIEVLGPIDVLCAEGLADVLLVSVGAMAGTCLRAAELLAEHDIGVTVVDPRWVTPIDHRLLHLAARFRLVATVEDGVRVGGVGARLAQVLRDNDIRTPVRDFGIPPEFLEHGSRGEILTDLGLTAPAIADGIRAAFAARHHPDRDFDRERA
ncbi:MAG TPA: 1-deoxy-D-xylulose-5-phosphate synthase [Pseudonocardiaceae bacterium]|jgi:1-deoxy-D-xylulose-5-phosphate synthase